MSIKTFTEFIAEGKKGPTNAGSIMKTDNLVGAAVSVNFADETLENLRRVLLDKFFKLSEDKEMRDIINKAVSTYVYCLDKKLRIDNDIIDKLAEAVNKSNDEIAKMLTKETDGFYGKHPNLYGVT